MFSFLSFLHNIELPVSQNYFNNFFINFKLIGVEFFLLLAIFIIFIYALVKATSKSMLMQINIIFISILCLVLCFILLLNTECYYFSFFHHFSNNSLIILIKQLITLILIIIFLLSLTYTRINFTITYEFSILLLLSVLAMFLLISCYDLVGIYLIIELQSFCFYILTATKSKSNFSTEAGLKYFILGSFSSGLLLFGISLLYGLTGLTNLHELKILFLNLSETSFVFDNMLSLSLILILVSLLFKFGLFPFHMYIPDVYTGAPTIVTTLFLVIQKLIILIVYLNFYHNIFIYYDSNLNVLLVISILGSIIFGSISALAQSKIKRLMAYSAIVNGGFLLIGLSIGNLDSISASILFLLIYIVLILSFFSIYLSVTHYHSNKKLGSFNDLLLLKKGNIILAICFSLVLFSIAGIPPLAGFFGKLFLFIAAIKEGFFAISLISILFTVVTAYYYIKLIKIIFFEKTLKFGFFKPLTKGEAYIIALGTLFNLLFFIAPKFFFTYINLLLLEVYYL